MKVKTPRDALRHYADEQERQSQREERPPIGNGPPSVTIQSPENSRPIPGNKAALGAAT
jgi:hypothetical protein